VFWQRLGFCAALILLASPITLTDPLDFPDWMAIVYSAFATAKVSLFGLGAALLIITTIVLAGLRFRLRHSY